MRLSILAALLAISGTALHAQSTGNTTIQPDCLIPFTFTAAGSFPATPTNNGAGDNRTKGCAAWTLMYQNSGMTSVSVTLQSGSSVSTSVSFGSFAGTISTGFVNPIVSDTGGSLQAVNGTADISWVRVNVAATGTGTLTGVLYGFRNSSAAVNGGGSLCVLSGSQSTGYVLTADDNSTGCSWQAAGGASVDNNTVKNAIYIADGGAANGITGTTTTTFPGAYAAGQAVIVKMNATNTGATTININSLGAKAVTKNGATALAAGNLVNGQEYLMVYDGTRFQVFNFTPLPADLPTITLTGDTTGTASGGSIATTTVKVNGTSVPTNAAADQLLGTTASATAAWASVPNCGDSSHALAYNTTTHAFSCQSITGAAGSPSFPINPQTSTYQVLAADFAACKVISVASGTFTATLVASGSQPTNGQCIWIVNYGSGVVTVARSGQNINGGTASITLPAGSATAPSAVFVVSDGTNYFASLQEVPASTTCTNQAVTAVNGTAAATCTTLTSAYVNNSIALTGTDINTSNQVTATHLSAALPVNQGGTGTTSTLTGLVRGNASAMTAAELSGDCTTSGSNAVTCAGFAPAITASRTYYICTKSNGSTCGSTDTGNGWNGNATASPTISDSNNCTAVATPCATLQGVETKIHGSILSAGTIITIYVADEANTGTDCLVPSNVTFSNKGAGLSPFSGSEQAIAGVFPPSYVYIYGNPTTPANVTMAGSNGCNSSVVGTVFNAVTADGNTALRINGIRSEGFGKTTTSYSAVLASEGGSILYAENYTCIQTASSNNSCAGAFNTGSTIRMGGTWSVTGAATSPAVIAVFGATGYAWDPLATSSANTTFSISSGSTLISAQQHSLFNLDRFTWTNTGNNATIFTAYWHSAVMYTEAYLAASCPTKCFIGTNNASGVTYQLAAASSYIDADCSTSNATGCTMTQQPTYHSQVQTAGVARVYNTGGTNTQVITAPDNILVGGCVSYFPGDGTPERGQCAGDSALMQGFTAPKANAASGQGQMWYDSANAWFRYQNGSSTSNYGAQFTANDVNNQLLGGSNTLGGVKPVDLTGDITTSGGLATTLATVTVPKGGTGAVTLAAHGPLVGEGTSAIVATSPGTSGQCYLSNGASSDPSFQACPGGADAGSSVASTTPVTVTTNTTSDQQLMELSLGVGYFNSSKQPFLFNGAGVYTTPAAQTPTLTFKVKLCTVSGCGSGTVVTLGSIVSTATLASVTNNSWNINLLGYTATTGATGNLEIHGPLSVDLGALTTSADSIFNDVNTAVSGNIDLTAALFVDFTVAFSTGSASNACTQRSGGVMPFAATAAPVTSVAPNGAAALTGAVAVNWTVQTAKTGNYTIATTDCNTIIPLNSASNATITVIQIAAGCAFKLTTNGAGGVWSIIQGTGSPTFSGDTARFLGMRTTATLYSDGTNYQIEENPVQILSEQNSTSDTLLCSTIGANTSTNFATTFTLPANILTTGRSIVISFGLESVFTTTVPTFTVRVKLCPSGTCITSGTTETNQLVSTLAATPGAAAAPAGRAGTISVVGTATPGGAVAVTKTYASPNGGGMGPNDTIANRPTFATNGALTIQISMFCSTNAASNSLTLTSMRVAAQN